MLRLGRAARAGGGWWSRASGVGRRAFSSEASSEAGSAGDAEGTKGKRVEACVPVRERKGYEAALRAERRAWREAELARKADTAAEEEAERERLETAKKAKRDARAALAAESLRKQAAVREEMLALRRTRLAGAVALGERERAARLRRQRTLVDALEEESRLWLVDDAAIEAKITEALFAAPGSTGLVTAQSHFYWRYHADFADDTGKGTPPADDIALLRQSDAAVAEATRRATTTERLIRTQAKHLTEYHEILEDADDIANAIQDLEVQVMKPRPFVKRTP